MTTPAPREQTHQKQPTETSFGDRLKDLRHTVDEHRTRTHVNPREKRELQLQALALKEHAGHEDQQTAEDILRDIEALPLEDRTSVESDPHPAIDEPDTNDDKPADALDAASETEQEEEPEEEPEPAESDEQVDTPAPRDAADEAVQNTIVAVQEMGVAIAQGNAELAKLKGNTPDIQAQRAAILAEIGKKITAANDALRNVDSLVADANPDILLPLLNAIETIAVFVNGKESDGEITDKNGELRKNVESVSKNIRRTLNLPEPEKPKTFIEKLTDGFEKAKIFLAYHMAPFLELIQKIKIPGVFDMETNLQGVFALLEMNRIILFSSFRNNHVTPIFDVKRPQRDADAINDVIKMAKTLQNIAPQYTVKEFCDAVCQAISKEGKGEFSLTEFATFAKENVFADQQKYARGLEKAEQQKTVTLSQNGDVIKLENGTTNLEITQKDGIILIKNKDVESKWKVTMAGMKDITIKGLKVQDGKLDITAVNPLTSGDYNVQIENSQLSGLIEKVANKELYAFSTKEGIPLQFNLIP